jgi:type IV secretion system protein VirD4
LQTVLDIFSNPEKLETALKLARESDAWGGTLARMAGQLMYFTEKERSSVLTTVSRHLQFLNSMAVAESTSKSTFDPAKLRSGKMTVYLILPPDHMRAQSALLRLWIGTLLRAVVAGGLQEKRKIHFILDEAASLGHMEAIDDALDKYRGYGIRLQFYFQSLGQLKTCFPNGQDQTLLSNTSQVYFGVNDNATADYISARLGESTIVVDSGGTSSGGSYQSTKGQHPTYSYGNSYNSSRNWQQQTRKLLKPEEIMVLPPRTAITFTPGVRPICTTLLPYFENRRMRRGQGWLSRSVEACTMLAASVALCVAVGLGAEALSQSVNSQSMSIDWMPSGPRYVNHNYIGW